MADLKDRILQSMCPTVMVPAYSELEPLGKAGYRYLMARDGLFVEGKTAWGIFGCPSGPAPGLCPMGPLSP
ncbi:MAG: hypothetical protein A2X99_02280 [Deltaproteobacteria bacterium GWB2_55_19]|nr:MAG: hypothetical protein A2X99_02280 [Deltaproteobacteria bacterium GWB2_55_19]